MALIEIVDNILKDLEVKYVAEIYPDLRKAFDTYYETLLHKLNHYMIKGQILKWLDGYLNNIQQFTYINDNRSDLKAIKYGVPEESVLGPLLF